VSPGFNAAKKTAWLACAPECGWTFAQSAEKSRLRTIDCELLGDVDMLAAAVITLARVAFCVLVGELRPLRREDGRARVILGGDQLDVIFLPAVLGGDRRRQLGIFLGQGTGTVKHRASR
jgi:hypothetical protein